MSFYSHEIQTAFAYDEELEIVKYVEDQLGTSTLITTSQLAKIEEEKATVSLSSV